MQEKQDNLKTVENIYELTPIQKGLLFYHLYDDINLFYKEQLVIEISGEFDNDMMCEAWKSIVSQYEILRSVIKWKEVKTAVQLVYSYVPVTVATLDFSQLDETNRDREYKSKLLSLRQSVNLTSEPYNFTICKLSKSHYSLVLSNHHVLFDGWSSSIIMKNLFTVYNALRKNLPQKNPETGCYPSYIAWLKDKKKDLSAEKLFWSNYLQSCRILPLKQRAATGDNLPCTDGEVIINIDEGLITKINHYVAKRNVTLASFFYAIWSLILSAYIQTDQIIFGTTESGRHCGLPGIEITPGLFINTVPFRIDLKKQDLFADFLLRAHQSVISRREYVHTALYDIRKYSETNVLDELFNSIFVIENYPIHVSATDIDNCFLTAVSINESTHYDITLLLDLMKQCQIRFLFKTDKFTNEFVTGIAKKFSDLITTIINSPNIAVSTLLSSVKDTQALKWQNENNIVVCSTFVSNYIDKYLHWWMERFGFLCSVSFAPYQQVYQQLTDRNSLVSTNTGNNVLLIRWEDYILENTIEESQIERIKELQDVVCHAVSRHNSLFYIGCFPLPRFHTQEIIETIAELNKQWITKLEQLKNVKIIDFSEMENYYQVETVNDTFRDKEAHIPYTQEYFASMGTTIARTMLAGKGWPFKVVVVDCDNTLWSGCCGEGEVIVSPPYIGFQKKLLELRRSGMLLALCSKNDEENVWKVFENNPNMVLQKTDITVWEINWEPKSANISKIANTLNLGMNSFIFIDDSPNECLDVIKYCPQVLTLQLPEEKYILSFTYHVWAFDKLQSTYEDDIRNAFHESEKVRNNQKAISLSKKEFLEKLALAIYFYPSDKEEEERIVQLAWRTNQFNSANLRWDLGQVRDLMRNPAYCCWSVFIKDVFGDYGLTGFLLTSQQDSRLCIHAMCLSCRVLGKEIEDAILCILRKYCENSGLKHMEFFYNESSKNTMVRRFFIEKGAQEIYESAANSTFLLDTDNIAMPEHKISLIYDFYSRQPLITPPKKGARAAFTKFHLPWEPDVKVRTNDLPYVWQHVEATNTNEHKAHYLPLKLTSAASLVMAISKKGEDNLSCYDKDYPGDLSEIEVFVIQSYQLILNKQCCTAQDDFFGMGGDSIKAMELVYEVKKGFGIEVPLKVIFQHPVVADFAKYLHGQIDGKEDKLSYPLSCAQKRIFILEYGGDVHTAYNLPYAFTIKGSVDILKLEKAINQLISRHEVLRSSFHINSGDALQKTENSIHFQLEFEISEGEIIVDDFIRPFDLSKPPLIRMKVIQRKAEEYVMLVDIHHIISDGTSLNIMMKELSRIYNGEELPKPKMQYKEYVKWQKDQLQSEKLKKQQSFWLMYLSGKIPILNLPYDYARQSSYEFEGNVEKSYLSLEITEKIRQTSLSEKVTPFMLMFAAYVILLHKYTDQKDILIGTSVSGRYTEEINSCLGMFVNTVTVRNKIEEKETLRMFLNQLKDNLLMVFDHQEYPFDLLLDKLDIPRDYGRTSLFDTMFIYQNMRAEHISLDGANVVQTDIPTKGSKFDLTVEVVQKDNQYRINWEYNTTLFKKTTILRIANHYLGILSDILDHVDREIWQICVMSQKETELLSRFNETDKAYPREKTVYQLFYEQAQAFKDKLAVVSLGKSTTYIQLLALADNVCGSLHQRYLVPGSVVGLALPKGIEYISSMLGVMKAGCICLPIDLNYPEAGIDHMLQESSAKVLITNEVYLRRFTSYDIPTIKIEDTVIQEENADISASGSADDGAYVIFTSGSEGMQKGVLLSHRNIINHAYTKIDLLLMTENDRICHNFSINFVASIWQMLSPLFVGACIYVYPNEISTDSYALLQQVSSDELTIVELIPNSVEQYLIIVGIGNEEADLSSLRYLVLTGDAVNPTLVKSFYARHLVPLINAYGQSECADDTAHYLIPKQITENEPIPIGRPSNNTKLFVLDKHLRQQPVGVIGDLYVGGDSLGQGYFAGRGLSQVNYLESQYGRIYKTGDSANWTHEGCLIFRGRKGDQIKIRGYRIALDEIETILLQHDSIAKAAVIAIEDMKSDKQLGAFIMLDEDIPIEEVRMFLKKRLPSFMIPSYIRSVYDFPLLPNGKIDKEQLREMASDLGNVDSDNELPSNADNRELIQCWRRVIGRNDIRVDKHFYEMGGDSIKAVQLCYEIQEKFGIVITLKEIIAYPTLKEMSQYLVMQKRECQ